MLAAVAAVFIGIKIFRTASRAEHDESPGLFDKPNMALQ
jgi:hypothetical protein